MAKATTAGMYVNPTTGQTVYVAAGGDIPEGHSPATTAVTKVASTANNTYIAPTDTSASAVYKPATSSYTNEYYNALRDKYAADTKAALTSPEMVQQAKQTRAQLAGSGVLGGTAYKNIQGQRVANVEKTYDTALANAISVARENEQQFNANEAAKAAQSQYQWEAAAPTRNAQALATAQAAAKAEVDRLAPLALKAFASDADRQAYNDAYDRYQELVQGRAIDNTDYTQQTITDLNKAKLAEALPGLEEIITSGQATPEQKAQYNLIKGIVSGVVGQAPDYATQVTTPTSKADRLNYANNLEPTIAQIDPATGDFEGKLQSLGDQAVIEGYLTQDQLDKIINSYKKTNSYQDYSWQNRANRLNALRVALRTGQLPKSITA